MTTRIVEVTRVSRVEIDIPDEMLTLESLQDFSRIMFKVDHPNDLIEYAARSFSIDPYRTFIEGIGEVKARVDFEDFTSEII